MAKRSSWDSAKKPQFETGELVELERQGSATGKPKKDCTDWGGAWDLLGFFPLTTAAPYASQLLSPPPPRRLTNTTLVVLLAPVLATIDLVLNNPNFGLSASAAWRDLKHQAMDQPDTWRTVQAWS